MSVTYDYPRPGVAVDMVVLTAHEMTLKVLLIVRRAEPFVGSWALPGGFVRVGTDSPGESLDEAAFRELREETQLLGRNPRWLCDLPEATFVIDVPADAEPQLTMDPSLPDAHEIIGVGWRKLTEVATDKQVRHVLAALAADIDSPPSLN